MQAQDFIKTKSQEEINCKIKKKDNDYVYFSYIDQNQVKETLLPVDSIQEYHYNYYKDSLSVKNGEKMAKKYEKFRLAANIGWGYRVAKTASGLTADERNIWDGLRSGLSWSVDGDIFINKFCGLGLKASFFNTWDNFDGYYRDNTGYFYSGNIQHNSRTIYIAPEVIWKFTLNKRKDLIWFGVSLGYMNYNQTMKGDNENIFSVYGGTFGVGTEIGYDIRLAKNLGLGISLYYESGALVNYTVKTGGGYKFTNDDSDAAEGLARIGVTVGFRFYK